MFSLFIGFVFLYTVNMNLIIIKINYKPIGLGCNGRGGNKIDGTLLPVRNYLLVFNKYLLVRIL